MMLGGLSAATILVACFATTTSSSLSSSNNNSNNKGDNINNNNENDDSATGSCESPIILYPKNNNKNQNNPLYLFHFPTASSTQDEAKRLIQEEAIPNDSFMFAVTATEQTNGRGTSGRQWLGARGNTFVTIGLRQQSWISTSTKLSLTLLPLSIGLLTAKRIHEILKKTTTTTTTTQQQQQQFNNNDESDTNNNNISLSPTVHVKWPNDVLVNHKKISGVLIESERDWFLVGVGVNVKYAPTIPLWSQEKNNPNRGRLATCIAEYSNDNNNNNDDDYIIMAKQLGIDLALDLANFVITPPTPIELQSEWKAWVDWSMEYKLRDSPTEEVVQPFDVEIDGRLKVRDVNGKERILVSDYFV